MIPGVDLLGEKDRQRLEGKILRGWQVLEAMGGFERLPSRVREMLKHAFMSGFILGVVSDRDDGGEEEGLEEVTEEKLEDQKERIVQFEVHDNAIYVLLGMEPCGGG